VGSVDKAWKAMLEQDVGRDELPSDSGAQGLASGRSRAYLHFPPLPPQLSKVPNVPGDSLYKTLGKVEAADRDGVHAYARHANKTQGHDHNQPSDGRATDNGSQCVPFSERNPKRRNLNATVGHVAAGCTTAASMVDLCVRDD